MKTFIAVFLLLVSCSLAASTSRYTQLSQAQISGSKLIQDLQQLGAEYVLEQGIFRSTKAPLPNGSWEVNETVSVYKKDNCGITLYNFTVILNSISADKVIRARYVVSYNRKTFNTLVTWFIYTELSGNGDLVITDQPSFIDVRDLKQDDSQYQDFLDQGVDYTVADAIQKKKLPAGDYRVARVFSIKDTGFSFPYGYRFLVKLANDDNDKYYRALITVWNTENVVEEDQGNYPPEYVIYPNK